MDGTEAAAHWPWLTGWQAKTLIAFGQTDMPRYTLYTRPWAEWFAEKWGFGPSEGDDAGRLWPVSNLYLVLTRVDWWKGRNRKGNEGRTPPPPALNSGERAEVRHVLRRYGGTGVKLHADLQADYRRHFAEKAKYRNALKSSARVLCIAASEGRITAYTEDEKLLKRLDWTPDGPLNHKWDDLRFERRAVERLRQAREGEPLRAPPHEVIEKDNQESRGPMADHSAPADMAVPNVPLREWNGATERGTVHGVGRGARRFAGAEARNPADAVRWVKAHHAVGWLAFNDFSAVLRMEDEWKALAVSIGDRCSFSGLDYETFLDTCSDETPVGMFAAKFRALKLALSRIMSPILVGDLPAYIDTSDQFEKKQVTPSQFAEGLTIHLFSGTLTVLDDDEWYRVREKQKTFEMAGIVWFKIADLISLFGMLEAIATDSREVERETQRMRTTPYDPSAEQLAKMTLPEFQHLRRTMSPSFRSPVTTPPRPLPEWLTLMQAVAWVCTQDPGAVWRADPEQQYRPDIGFEEAFIEVYFPPRGGLTLLTLDAWHGVRHSVEPGIIPSDPAIEKLVDWLRAGLLPSTGVDRDGNRVPITSGRWRGWYLSSSGDARVLVPCRAALMASPVIGWADILICRRSLFALRGPRDDNAAPPNASNAIPTYTRRDTERESEADRERMIQSFAKKQRQIGHWISLAEIADWCSRESGSITSDEKLKIEAYRQLTEALLRGDFDMMDRTRVIYLHASVRWFKMTRERFEACPFDLREDRKRVSDLKVSYLECCWIPARMGRAWFARKRLPLPDWFSPPVLPSRTKPVQPVVGTVSSSASGFTTESFARERDKLPLMIEWAKLKYGSQKLPSRMKILQDHRDEFGTIANISEPLVRVLRRGLADESSKAGGAPTHGSRKEK